MNDSSVSSDSSMLISRSKKSLSQSNSRVVNTIHSVLSPDLDVNSLKLVELKQEN